ncbi:hypothetical protein CYMTET_24263, partial [Cymbomonas tetramitiformis]
FSVFNMQTERRVRTLTMGPEISKSNTLVNLAFSGDSKLLLVQCGPPDWVVSCWKWYNGKVSLCTKVESEVTHVSFNPMDANVFVTTGPKQARFWKMKTEEETVKGINLSTGNQAVGAFTHHTWLSGGQLAVATDTGKIIIYDNTELKGVIQPEAGIFHVVVLATLSRGFVAVAHDGTFLMYEVATRSADNVGGGYQLSRKFKVHDSIGEDLAPVSLSVSLTEEHLMVSSAEGSIGKVTFANLEASANEKPFELLNQGFHAGAITGMDVSSHRPLLITCGEDKTVRVWNYLDKTCRMKKQFFDDLHCVAIHPSGFYALVGMGDKLRLFSVTKDDLLQLREFHILQCKEARFSHGGHFFAAANKAAIQVYTMFGSSHSQNTAILKGHSAAVRSLCWANNDLRLVSASASGEVYEWKMDTMARDHAKEHVNKTCQFHSAVYTSNAQGVVATGSDKAVKHLVSGNIEYEADLADVQVTELLVGHDDRQLITALESGIIRTYMWLGNATHTNDTDGHFNDYRWHSATVSRLRLSNDGNFLFSCDGKGAIYICDVQFIIGGLLQEKLPVDRAEDLALMVKEELDEQAALMQELQGKLLSVQSAAEYQQLLRDNEWRDNLNKVSDQLSTANGLIKEKERSLERVRQETMGQAEEKVQELETAHAEAAEELENLYEKKLMVEQKAFMRLKEQSDDERYQFQERIAMLEEAHNKALMDLKSDFELKLAEEMQKVKEAEETNKHDRMESEEMLSQTEEDCDLDIMRVKEGSMQELMAMKSLVQRLKADNALLTRNTNKLSKRLEEEQSLAAQKEREKSMLRMEMKDLDTIIDELRRGVNDRNKLIEKKESLLSDTKQTMAEIEKQKFVLDYKVNKLKQEAEPREEKIDELVGQINSLDGGLQGQMRTLQKHKQVCHEKDLRIQGLNEEMRQLKEMMGERDNYIKGFVHDLDRVLQLPHGRAPGMREEAFRFLHRAYCLGHDKPNPPENSVVDELTRQRDFLEYKNKYLQKKTSGTEVDRQTEARKARQENVLLLKELGDLRRQNKALDTPAASPNRPCAHALLADPRAQHLDYRSVSPLLARNLGASSSSSIPRCSIELRNAAGKAATGAISETINEGISKVINVSPKRAIGEVISGVITKAIGEVISGVITKIIGEDQWCHHQGHGEVISGVITKAIGVVISGVIIRVISEVISGVITKVISEVISGVITKVISEVISGVITKVISEVIRNIITKDLEKDLARTKAKLQANKRDSKFLGLTPSQEYLNTITQQFTEQDAGGSTEFGGSLPGSRPGTAGKKAHPNLPTAGGVNRLDSASRRSAGGASPGVLLRGSSTRAINELVSMEREKIMELVSQLEHQHKMMEEQQSEIDELKSQIHHICFGGPENSEADHPRTILEGGSERPSTAPINKPAPPITERSSERFSHRGAVGAAQRPRSAMPDSSGVGHNFTAGGRRKSIRPESAKPGQK